MNREFRRLASILHELQGLSVDFTSAAWSIARRNIAPLWFKRDRPRCAVQSGDKPAADSFCNLIGHDTSATTRAVCGLASGMLMACLIVAPGDSAAADTNEPDLAGLWESRRYLGPELQGPIVLREIGDRVLAEIGGYRIEVTTRGRSVGFSAPDGSRFEGVREANGDILGHWVQPRSRLDGNVFATPLLLRRQPAGWRGEIRPQPDTGTFYLMLHRQGNGLVSCKR